MTVYYVTFVIIIFLCGAAQQNDLPQYLDERKSHVVHTQTAGICFFLAACVLIFVAGFRYRVGADYGAYYYGYTGYIQDLPTSLRNVDEPGYGIIAWIATRFVDDGAAAVFVASLVTVGAAMLVIYHHTDRLLIAGVLYFLTCWDGSFNGVRQYLAVSMVFCGYGALRERNLVKYLCWVFVGFLFHRSAIVMAVLFFVVNRKISGLNIAILIAVAGAILMSYDRVFSFANVIMDKDYSLDNEYTLHVVNRLRVAASCVPAVAFLVAYAGRELNEKQTFHMNITILHAALRVFTMNSALLFRIGLYTSPFLLMAIPELLQDMPEDGNRRIYTAGFVVMYTGLWWYEIVKSGSLNQFHWIWERL